MNRYCNKCGRELSEYDKELCEECNSLENISGYRGDSSSADAKKFANIIIFIAVFFMAVALFAAAAFGVLRYRGYLPFANRESDTQVSLAEGKSKLEMTQEGRERFLEGVAFFNQDKYQEALSSWRKGAELGNAKSMFNIGYLYDSGTGVPEDPDKATEWYRKAAEAGFSEAQYALGLRYFEGRSKLKDAREAVDWIRKAADQGHREAIAAMKKFDPDYTPWLNPYNTEE